MWFLPTRNRPQACEELIRAMIAAGDVPDVAVMLDGPAYQIEWPAHWHIHVADEHLEFQRALNALLKAHPHEPTYGILTDHCRPETEGWAEIMEERAGSGHMVLANDRKNRINPRNGMRRLTAATCYGGDLIRAIGWIWLDTVVHMYGDDALEDIGHELNIIRYLPDVIVRDMLVREREIPIDANHKRMWNGRSYIGDDQRAYESWRAGAFQDLINRLSKYRCSRSSAS